MAKTLLRSLVKKMFLPPSVVLNQRCSYFNIPCLSFKMSIFPDVSLTWRNFFPLYISWSVETPFRTIYSKKKILFLTGVLLVRQTSPELQKSCASLDSDISTPVIRKRVIFTKKLVTLTGENLFCWVLASSKLVISTLSLSANLGETLLTIE